MYYVKVSILSTWGIDLWIDIYCVKRVCFYRSCFDCAQYFVGCDEVCLACVGVHLKNHICFQSMELSLELRIPNKFYN